MNIIVCIKQVPDTNDVKIDPKTNTLIREGVASVVNPFDVFAVEEALRLKTKLGGIVTAITMGPPQAETALREVIAMGADKGVLVSDRAFAGADTWATSYTLAMAIRKIRDFGLIICGKQATDGDTAQVGPGLATHLNLPQITYVRKIEEIDESHIIAQRMLEDGNEAINSSLPCVITVVKEINQPRIISLRGRMIARRAEITKWTAKDINAEPDKIGLDGSPTKVVRIFTPSARPGGRMLTGTPEECVRELVDQLTIALAARKKG